MSTTPVRRWDKRKKAYVHSLRPLAFYFCPAESTVSYRDLLLGLHHGCRITLQKPLEIDAGIADRAPAISSALHEYNSHPMWGADSRPLIMLADFAHIARETKSNLKLLKMSPLIEEWRGLQAEEDEMEEEEVDTFANVMVKEKIGNLHLCRCASMYHHYSICIITIPNSPISTMQVHRNVRAVRSSAEDLLGNTRPGQVPSLG